MAPALLVRGVRVEICKKDRGTRLVRIICEVGEIEEYLTFHSTEKDPKTKTATSESSPDKTLCFDPDTKNPGDDGDDQKKSSSPKNRYQSVSGDDETMETMNPQKSMPNSKNEDIKKGYLKIGEKIVSIVSSSPDVSTYRFSGDDQIKSSSPIPPVIVSEDPGFKKFQAQMERRVCELCGYRSPHDLGTWFYHGATHYTCTTCRMGAVPAEKPMRVAEVGQKTLEGGD